MVLPQVTGTTRQNNKGYTAFERRLPTLPDAFIALSARDGERISTPRTIKDFSLELMRENLGSINSEGFRVSHTHRMSGAAAISFLREDLHAEVDRFLPVT